MELMLSFARKDPSSNNRMMLDYADKSFVDDVAQLIEVLIAIDMSNEAVEVQKRALDYFENDKIKLALESAPSPDE